MMRLMLFSLFASSSHALRAGAVRAPRGAVRALRAGAAVMADDEFAGYTPKTVFMFPGQGAQTVGMGAAAAAEVPAAAALYAKASEILGYDLLAKCTEGPKEELDTTAVSQPAIFVASMAAVEKLRAEKQLAAFLKVLEKAPSGCDVGSAIERVLRFYFCSKHVHVMRALPPEMSEPLRRYYIYRRRLHEYLTEPHDGSLLEVGPEAQSRLYP